MILVPDVAKREKSCHIKHVPMERHSPSHSLKQSIDFELFISESVADSAAGKKNRPIKLRWLMQLFVFY